MIQSIERTKYKFKELLQRKKLKNKIPEDEAEYIVEQVEQFLSKEDGQPYFWFQSIKSKHCHYFKAKRHKYAEHIHFLYENQLYILKSFCVTKENKIAVLCREAERIIIPKYDFDMIFPCPDEAIFLLTYDINEKRVNTI